MRVAGSVAKSRPFAWAVTLLERLDREGPDLVRILTYHRVEWNDAIPPPYPRITIPPDLFAEQMRYVRDHFHVVSVEEMIHAVRAQRSLPPRSVLISFDDGYRDFRTQAWPVLRALKLPVVLFVPTAFPGDPSRIFWWDRLHHALLNASARDSLETPVGVLPLRSVQERERAFTQLRDHVKQMPHDTALSWVGTTCHELAVPPPPPAVLSWDELRALVQEGVSVASHTRTHPLLTRIPAEEVRAEAAGSRRDLERELRTELPVLAYPGGAFNDAVARIIADEGYVLAFTTTRGVNDLRSAHPLKLRRINVGRQTSLALLRAQLMGRAVSLNRFYPVPA